MTLRRTSLIVVLVLLLPIRLAAQEHEHDTGRVEKLGTVTFQTSCTAAGAAAVQSRRVAAALLRVLARHRGIQRDARRRPVVRDGGVGCCAQPVGQSFRAGRSAGRVLRQGRDAVAHAKAIGPKTPRETRVRRGGLAAVRELRDLGSADAPAGVPRRDGGARGGLPGRHRGLDLLRAGACRGGIAGRQDVRRPAEGRRDPREAVRQPARSPWLAHYIIHSYDVPPLAGPRAGRRAALREDRARRRRMRSTCRRTPSRASGCWQESIDSNIAVGAMSRSATGATAEELHAMDYRTYAYLQTGAGRRRRGSLLDALPEVQGAVRPGRDRVGARRVRPASLRWPRFRRATRSSAAHGPTPRSSCAQPSRYLYAGGDDLLREGASAPRAPATRRPRARRDRRAAARSGTG